jgi:DNA uptake protein and related DNA-binding proteins
MWTCRHWKILFVLSGLLFGLLSYREYERPPRMDLPILEAAQLEEIEEQIVQEISYYRDGKLLLNQAPREKILELPGIGPVLADRILQYRSSNGSFRNVDELRQIKGIGVKRLEALRGKVIVE